MSQGGATHLSREYDEFNEKTTTRHTGSISASLGYYETLTFNYRHIKTKDFEALMLDCIAKAEEWFFVGRITFNCDQENINVDFEQTSTDTSIEPHLIGDDSTVYTYELGYFNMDRDTVEKICKANLLKIRVTGQDRYTNLSAEENSLFQMYSRQWYNQFYDSSMYAEALAVKTGGGGGCFIATAAMGDYNHPKVVGLRNFRDQYLEEGVFGRKVIDTYYKYSPKPAGFIGQSNVLRTTAYFSLVQPAHIISQFLLRNK
jgi:hypothetical protein